MRHHFMTGLLVLGMVVVGHGLARAAEVDVLAADEQTLKAANVGTDGPALLEFFRKRTLTEADRDRIALLVKQLGDDDFSVREKAVTELVNQGPKAVALLRPALRSADLEVARRAEAILKRLGDDGKSAGPDLPEAAARLLAVRKPADAVEVLLAYLPFANHDTVIEEIQTTLATVAAHEGQPDAALVKAMSAGDSLRRGVAGAAMARAGVADQKTAVRKLLQDPEQTVRLRVGLALAAVKDKESVPVLIDLLSKLPPEQAWPVEDLLHRLAGDKAPAASSESDAAGREKYRDAWAAWWRDHGARVEMPALDGPRPLLGYTLIVPPDSGEILELGRDGKPRWKVSGLKSPFQAEVLLGERLLVAEYSGRVTERNLKGEILWEKTLDRPMMCQRLPNGNTFIVNLTLLLEVDPQGKETIIHTHSQQGCYLLAAKKLRNGQIVAVQGDGVCLRLDAAGKELSRFEVGRVSNNCLDVMPNGNVLVAKFFDGKVTEYDGSGKVVWEADCPSAFSAQRLPNGNTLIACHQPPRVVELDRAGKTVWEHQQANPNHRPWFASRR